MSVNNTEVNIPDWDYTGTGDNNPDIFAGEWSPVSAPETSGAEAFSVEDGIGISAEREG